MPSQVQGFGLQAGSISASHVFGAYDEERTNGITPEEWKDYTEDHVLLHAQSLSRSYKPRNDPRWILQPVPTRGSPHIHLYLTSLIVTNVKG